MQNSLVRPGIDNLSPQPTVEITQVVENPQNIERTAVMKARGEALVAFARYWMEKERQKSGLSHKVDETARELLKADDRAKELMNGYAVSYNEKPPPAMLDRDQNELINKSMWVIRDEDARHRLSFEGQHAQLVYEHDESKTQGREQTIDRDTTGWSR